MQFCWNISKSDSLWVSTFLSLRGAWSGFYLGPRSEQPTFPVPTQQNSFKWSTFTIEGYIFSTESISSSLKSILPSFSNLIWFFSLFLFSRKHHAILILIPPFSFFLFFIRFFGRSFNFPYFQETTKFTIRKVMSK